MRCIYFLNKVPIKHSRTSEALKISYIPHTYSRTFATLFLKLISLLCNIIFFLSKGIVCSVAVLMLKTELVQEEALSMARHLHRRGWCSKTSPNDGKVSYTDPIVISKCLPSRCREILRLQAKGKSSLSLRFSGTRDVNGIDNEYVQYRKTFSSK